MLSKARKDPAVELQKLKARAEHDPVQKLKLEIAAELGLLEKVQKLGWGALSARESGSVGGLMTKRMKEYGIIPR